MTDLRRISDEELLQLMEDSGEYNPYVLGMEYLRRTRKRKYQPIRHPADIIPLISSYATKKQEHFLTVPLNGAHVPMSRNLITKGLVNRTLIHPREIFRRAIQQNAVAIILAHNHPSGNVQPSSEDKVVTERLQEASEVIGIRLLDHIVFAKDSYFSFLEHGLL